ncbi:MAG: thermonuclease family protein [Sedimentisphaerales bacterium]
MKNKKIKYAQSRLQKKILLLSALLLLSAVVWFDKTFHPLLKTSVPASISQNSDWNKYNEKIFVVVKVVDGDTIDINVPDGNFPDTRIRLLGVDTPETKNPHTKVMYFGPEASKFTSDTVLGQIVFVVMDEKSKPRDKYHRLLCHIRLADGRILNEELVSQGFAYADTRFPHSFYEKYIRLEKTAREEKKGLWEKVTPDQMPQWRQKIEK